MSKLLYQIDFSAVAAGKRVSSSKRKIRWRFGFANQQAVRDGLTGMDCRGEEHEVSIVWSITSGKRRIHMDGKEVHFATNRSGLLDFSWSTKDNHVIKVFCHAAPPNFGDVQPGFRQYDLSLDGQSFFTMPKVFQIGVKGAVPNNVPGAYRTNHPISPVSMGSSSLNRNIPTSREQEEIDLRRAIEASIKDAQQHLGETPKHNEGEGGSNRNSQLSTSSVDLLGFGGGPPVGQAADSRSVASFYSAPTTYGQDYQSPPPATYPAGAASVASGALVPAVAPPGYYQAPPTYTSPPPPQQAYAQQAYASPPPVPPAPAPTPNTYYVPSPQPTYDAFSGSTTRTNDVFGLHNRMAVNDDPFAPKPPAPPTHEDLASAILASYQTTPDVPLAPTTPGGVTHTPQPGETMNGVSNDTPNGHLSMNSLAITTAEEKPKSEFEKALTNLVNVDHIDEPAEGEIKLTMMKKEEEAIKTSKGKSIPMPPAGKNMVGSNAPLSQIRKDFVHGTQERNMQGIMNAPPPGAIHPGATNTGALVVHGQGPPPLQQQSGFGLGATLPNGGFQNQQNLAGRQQYNMRQQQY